jgi:hypothetical protein
MILPQYLPPNRIVSPEFVNDVITELKDAIITMSVNAETIFQDNQWLLENVSTSIAKAIELIEHLRQHNQK